MAVARVYGAVCGIDIVLEHMQGDVWQVPTPPLLPDGKYIVEVYAEDDAGNISYAAKYLYTFDSANFTASFVPYVWQSRVVFDDFSTSANLSDYTVQVDSKFETLLLLSDFASTVKGVHDGTSVRI